MLAGMGDRKSFLQDKEGFAGEKGGDQEMSRRDVENPRAAPSPE
jgi:hypothetical protein